MLKSCPICGKNFEAFHNSKKYCDPICREKGKKIIIEGIKKITLCKKCKCAKEWPKTKYCAKCYKSILNEQNQRQKEMQRKRSRISYYKNKDDPLFKFNRNERYKIYHKRRREEDPQFAVAVRLRGLLYNALRKYTLRGKAFSSKKYGIDFTAIIEHLKLFPAEITKWHIDHIRPLASFDLENPEEIKKAFSPENHQWLIASENIKKGDKF